MDNNNMRNIVILKDLPSNLIEEAFVVLKKNQKIKKPEYIENKNNNFEHKIDREDENEFIIKEAELLISNYISKVEDQDLLKNKYNANLTKKYKNLKRFSIILSGLVIVAFYIIIGR